MHNHAGYTPPRLEACSAGQAYSILDRHDDGLATAAAQQPCNCKTCKWLASAAQTAMRFANQLIRVLYMVQGSMHSLMRKNMLPPLAKKWYWAL
jgi:hypothetical protein